MTAKKPKEAVILIDLDRPDVYVFATEEQARDFIVDDGIGPRNVIIVKGKDIAVKRARNTVEFFDLTEEGLK